jgi:hypothetical protein
MFELVQGLGAAKSRQDVAAALKLLDEDMVLEAPAFGSRSRGIAENEAALGSVTRCMVSPPKGDIEPGRTDDCETPSLRYGPTMLAFAGRTAET